MACVAALLLSTLTGCTALMVGGAAAGGYVVGKDERPAGQIVDDGSITAAIKSRLLADESVSGLSVNVDTYQGAVILRGELDSYAQRQRAEQIARSVEGVVAVDNRIEVTTPR